jgi:hypothetical protein
MKTLTKAEMEKAIAAAIWEIENVVICPTCGCKNGSHYSTCVKVAHLFKSAK